MRDNISVLVPVLNERDDIGECLIRVAQQSQTPTEIVVADGGSVDGTREQVERMSRTTHDVRIRLVDNPRRLQAAGLNTALSASTGDVVVRLDARSFVERDYIERCVATLDRTGAAVVGGQMAPRFGQSAMGRAVAVANSSWWGAGPARFHGHGGEGPADTVYLGTFRRAWLDRVGGWAEDVGVNEDYELNYRIRSAGGVVWFDPALKVGYQARTTLPGVVRQYVRYGRSKATVVRRHPASVRPRQVVPALLLPAAAAVIAGGRARRVGSAAVVGHAALVGVAATRSLGITGDAARTAAVAASMHWSWTVGFWLGTVRRFPAAEEAR
jgi:cellulose synthase/poly-beta-1,6-N-acetylglucosamine synthase-like glycosyltransferase